MGTVAYLHRVNHEDLWSWLADVRAVYLQDSLLARTAREYRQMIDAEDDADNQVDMLMRWTTSRAEKAKDLENLTVDLQLFDERDGTWLVRALERGRGGWHFAEVVRRHPQWPVAEIHYDDTTDMPEGMLELKPVVDWMGDQISRHLYVIFPVITVADMDSIIHRIRPNGART